MIKHWIWLISFCLVLKGTVLSAQSIAEKKANLQSAESDLDKEMERLLIQVNQETQQIHAEIHLLYDEVWGLYQADANPDEYRSLLDLINQNKQRLLLLENRWRDLASKSNRTEGYGLWHAPDTNLEQLIIDYGSQDFVYLIPPEVGAIRLSVDSNLPIPRAAWSEMLELILNQNGVGIRTLNPYLRQLYLLKQNHSNLRLITNRWEDLEVLPNDTRIAFVLSPEPSEVRRSFSFLERFINPNTMVLQILGRDILLIGQVGEIQDLLKLYDFIASNRGDKDYRLIPIFKVPAEEMARILAAIFDQSEQAAPPPTPPDADPSRMGMRGLSEVSGLRIVLLQNMTQALFVVGTKEEVRKAEEVIRNVESKIGGARDKVVHWYTVRHSDPEELADVLFRVYLLMITTGTGFEQGPPPPGFGPKNVENEINLVSNSGTQLPSGPPPILPPQKEPPLLLYGQEGFYQEGGFVVNPAPAQPGFIPQTEPNVGRDNFIVDPKTGSIVMVVEADILPKMKELLRRLDVPKKMVQIETLLFEKVLSRDNTFGLNLLRIGDHIASNRNRNGGAFNNIFPVRDDFAPANAGVFEFLLSRKHHCGIPAFDLAYRFLLSQDDVQINSNPSILTMNQTPATIAINEEISINTGIFEVETAKGITNKDAFTRAQYGITISVKPTIHLNELGGDDEWDFDYVTLETDITFDTIQPGGDPARPDVTRRHITNQVQVPDGDTVILGGLRRKISNDSRDSVPFLGELPGLGKLFSINAIKDNNTEMFIFITPHIVKDPKEQLQCLRQELLCLRPGDVPYFLECVEEAHRYEKNRLMEGSMSILFGRPREKYYISDCCKADCDICEGEYDGR